MTANLRLATLLGLLLSTACLASDGKGGEDELPADDGKDDSQRTPTDHGPIGFGQSLAEELTAAHRYHAWTFELSGDATVSIETSYAVRGQRRTDTVLYLYREGPTGWGSYIARNDDHDGNVYSEIVKTLGAGRYRILVKGYLTTTRGKFKVTVDCDGSGCSTPVQSQCLFGEQFGDLDGLDAVHVAARTVLTAASLPTLDAAARDRIVRALRESAHTDVTTAEEAFERVDGGEINSLALYEPAGQRSFVAIEYGAGDNSYGAIFDRVTGAMVAPIHDGFYEGCTVTNEVCRLPATYPDLRSDATFELREDRVVTDADQLSGVELDEALAALRRTYDDVVSVADGLSRVDQETLHVRSYFHTTTNTDLVAFEYGAGDTSLGAIFYLGSLQIAAVIEDSDLQGCSLFMPIGGMGAGEACRGVGDCAAGLLCTGVFAGAGACVSTPDLPGEGVECATDAACGSAALVCAGATRGGGLCNPAWMRGSFADAVGAAVPDAGILARGLAVRGLATVDTDVVLRLTVDHPRASQLRVTLTNPAGNEVLVRAGAAGDDGHALVIDQPVLGFSGDEQVNGEWTLRVQDRTAGHAGTLRGWTLMVTSRWD